MSSPNHPTSDIKDAFSSNFPDYISASPDYVSASPGKNFSESSNDSSGLVLIASPTLLLFHDDPYMKELLPPKEQVSFLTSSPNDSFNPFRRQACTLVPPSFSVYTPTPPQIFEIGKSSIKMHLKHHEKQIEDILNYLKELYFYRIEKMEERLVNVRMIIQRDFDEQKTELEKVRSQISRLQKKHIGQKDKIAFARFRVSTLEITLKDIQARHQLYIEITLKNCKGGHHHQATRLDPYHLQLSRIQPLDVMAPKKTSTSAAPAMNQAAIWKVINDRVAAALKAQAANMANTNNTNRNLELRETPAVRKLFSRSNYTEDWKVKFATGTLTEDVLSWWNSYDKPMGIEQDDKITWSELKRLLTNKYYPRTEVMKIEDEFYNLVVKGNDLKTYARRFQELAVLCPNMPQTLEEAINITQRNTDNNNYQDNYNNYNRNNDYHHQQNKRQETVRTYVATPTKNKRDYRNKGHLSPNITPSSN
nr:reverse transcriptase domain-containing protein [Tanacetum cinerariifolium]